MVDDICKNVLLLDILCVTLNLLHLEQFRDHNESLSVTDKGKAIVYSATDYLEPPTLLKLQDAARKMLL